MNLIKHLPEDSTRYSILISQPDPDAIGSAFALKEFLDNNNHSADIYYSGAVGHPQNTAMCNSFGLLDRMKKVPKETPENIILVDSSKIEDGRLPWAIKPVIVIDHHREADDVENCFSLIDTRSGSTCTLIVEMWGDTEISKESATLLALGIYTDTKNNIYAGERDLVAYSWARERANQDILRSLILYKRAESFYKNLASALKRRKHIHATLISCVGKIPSSQGDDLAMIADEFTRKKGVMLAVVWGMVEFDDGRKAVRVCARSEDMTTTLSEVLSKRFGENSGAKQLPTGLGEGGALFHLNFEPWLTEDESVTMVERRLHEWFFDKEDHDTPRTP